MSTKTLPDQITDLLIALIFVGKLFPGDKLPPERKFAEYLGVDRTSLRMALKTLTRMNVISAVQGSGIRVLNYKVDSGLDFLTNLYQVEGLDLGGELMLSGLEVFNCAIPLAIKVSVEKNRTGSNASQVQAIEIIEKMYLCVEQGSDILELAILDAQLVDKLLSSTDNLYMQLAAGSSRPIRIALAKKNYELIDVKQHLDWLMNIMMRVVSRILSVEDMLNEYSEYINKTTEPLKAYLMSLPVKPRLKSSPLHNEKNIIDLDDIMKKNITD